MLPPDGHSFVIKARHSIFYGTPLEYLLDQMAVDRLVLCGQVTEQCIFYSALDAHVRHFKVAAPTDGVAAIYEHLAESIVCGPDPERHRVAIQEYIDAGYDHVYLHQVGPDQAGFFDFYEREVLPAFA